MKGRRCLTRKNIETDADTRTAKIIGFEHGDYPYAESFKRSVYEKDKPALQVELLKVQHWVQETGQKLVMFFYTDTADAPWTVIRSNDKKGKAELHPASRKRRTLAT
ncbi:MAG: polyphosphate kinase 2 (PPK2 family) [Candidatus Azotimanducaceae bacterium]|jgi:polyphosphate kinase 2 (PPK2 family)